ncbi:hypothetical protein B9H04_17575 [Halorubrum ezzemoulense DSM 17463]|uniref:Glycosyltransferase subfamily 4-like N-terminal domain-containing protein n=1 Tax=Halorubrum ezzemoulense DSM 17463 TaxID=1121945 RepID=A0A1X4G3E5_HALEZ|nr:glycosyltransferase family 4 protein [Halorubrum ezzemoulense]OSO88143.1 hypothetical protein B9H04_17575 [Halorubrum ezzemoulense DSM 17463]
MNKKVLAIIPGTSLSNPSEGHQVRAYNLLTELEKRGWEVTVLEQGQNENSNFENCYKFKNIVPDRLNDINPFLWREIIDKGKDADIVHVKTFSGVTAAKVISQLPGYDFSVVYDAQNVEAAKIKQSNISHLNIVKRLFAPIVVSNLERLSVRLADKVVAVSDKDYNRFNSTYDIEDEKIEVIPSGSNLITSSKDDYTIPAMSTSDLCIVFHGTYDYYPNKEAIEAISDVAEGIESGDVHFVIAGKGVPSIETENLSMVGFVDNLEALLGRAEIAFAPIRRGGGTKLKIIDYMAAELPIVTTTVGAEGLGICDGEEAIIHDPDEDSQTFRNSLIELIECSGKRRSLGSNARKRFEEGFSWESIGVRLDNLYTGLLNEK